jgi:hypothetical protein
MAVVVEGYTEVMRAFARAERDTRLGVRRTFREAAEPVKKSAEELALSEVHRMPYSPKWAKMRIGVTRREVYVAPRQRGIKGRGDDPRRRPNLAVIMGPRVFQAALDRHRAQIVHMVEHTLDVICENFNAGGHL